MAKVEQMNIIETLESEHIASLAKDIPDFAPGDTVKVGYKVTCLLYTSPSPRD